MYSEALLRHFQNPHNVGNLEDADVEIEVTNPVCGDILHLAAILQEGRIATIRYQTRGCTASIAAGSALTVLLVGKRAADLASIDRVAIEKELGGLSSESKHAAVLAEDGVKALLNQMKSSGGGGLGGRSTHPTDGSSHSQAAS